MDKLQVVVVGAGAAGVSAAARLMEHGVRDVVVLEAGDRMGGRIHTALFENAVLDLGAQWVHGEVGNVVCSMANKYGLLTPSGTGILDTPYIVSTGKTVDQEVTEKIIGILSLIHKTGDTMLKDFKGSLGDYYNLVFQEKMQEEFCTSHSALGRYFLDWFHKFENCINGADSWFETSGVGLTEYWECEGNLLLSWKSGGYQKVLDLLMKKYPSEKVEVPVGSNVIYKKEVTHIKWKNLPEDKVILECSDGTSYTADHAIVTVSLGVLKEKAHSLFSPALPPHKLNAVKGLGFGCVNKIYLKFPYRWWPEEHSGFSFLWTDEDTQTFKPLGNVGEGVGGRHWLQDIFGFYYVDNHPLVLCGWIVGPSARYMEHLSDEHVIEGCFELLQKFAGKGFNVTVPRPVFMVRSCWSSNPHFHGAYSYRSMASETLQAFASHLAEPLTSDDKKPVLLFAGEATHEHFYSTVHGAVESGWREANRIVAYYGCQIPSVPVLDHINFCQVIIIGAGIAGLAAAKTLIENGIKDIKILEAQDHPGGRINSVFHNGRWIETGAQWIHGENNEVWKLADKYDLLSTVTSCEGEGLYIRDDGVVFDTALVDDVHKVVTEILEDCEQYACGYLGEEAIPKSVGQHLRQKFEQYLDGCAEDSEERRRMKEELFDWHLRFQVIDNSCTVLDKLSAKAWGNYSFSGGTNYVNFKNGYSSLVRNIVEELPAGTLCLNSPVMTVKWQQSISSQVKSYADVDAACKKQSAVHVTDSVCQDPEHQAHHNGVASESLGSVENLPVLVSCSTGTMYAAGHVIVTCSLGCLKACCNTMFEPGLPHCMIQAIEDMGYAAINKIFLDFKKPWWTPDIKGFQLVWSKDSNAVPSHNEHSSWLRDISGFDVIPELEGVLLGWVGGKGAQLVEEVTEDEIGQHCTELLRRITQNKDIPLPCHVIRSQWYKNPYIRGGYSNSTILCDASSRGPLDLATPVWAEVCYGNAPHECKYPVVLLAGEAAHERYFSTTHGAYESGQAQARVILDYLNGQRSSSIQRQSN